MWLCMWYDVYVIITDFWRPSRDEQKNECELSVSLPASAVAGCQSASKKWALKNKRFETRLQQQSIMDLWRNFHLECLINTFYAFS